MRITTGFVEPHFFAGFSGGPKMVAARARRRSRPCSCSTTPAASATRRRPGAVTDGNPVHDDIRAAAAAAPPHFSLDVILNREQRIITAFAGELFAMHDAACAAARALRDGGGRRRRSTSS